MAWTSTVLARSHDLIVWDILSSAAPDTELILTHNLGHVPMFNSIMAHNAQANAAGYWIDDIGPATLHLHKPVGGAGSRVHITAWTMNITMPWTLNYQKLTDIP